MSRIELEEYLGTCKPQTFNNKNVIVEKDVLEEMLEELREKTPEEIKRYQKIIANQDEILAAAQAKADQMIEQASRRSNQLISEHEIMQQSLAQANDLLEQANAQAQQIVDNATEDAREIREGAIGYTDDLLKSLQAIISSSMDGARAQYDGLLSQLKSSLDVVAGNRAQLRPETSQEGEIQLIED